MISIDINKLPDSLDKDKFISEKMVNMNLDIEFIYCSHFKNAKILRDFIEAIWKSIWLPDKHMARFILVIDELNNNAKTVRNIAIYFFIDSSFRRLF